MKIKIVGHEDGDENSARILNLVISATWTGFEYEADIRHAEIVVKELGLEYVTVWICCN